MKPDIISRVSRYWLLGSALACACTPPAPLPVAGPEKPAVAPASGIPGTRTAWVRTLSTGCEPAELELVLPFYEGIRLAPAAAALRGAKSEYLDLAYPGPLSMPLVAWRCGEGKWSAVVSSEPLAMPVAVLLRTTGDEIEARMECFGECTFHEVGASGGWQAMASAVTGFWHLEAPNPPLASRYDRYRYFVRQWVADDATTPLRRDWSRGALEKRMRDEPPRTIAFAFGLDPNEVDLEGHYFWSDGALDEVRALVESNAQVAQFRWLNLRTYKYAIPNLGIERSLPTEVRAAAKQYAKGVNDFSQYVFQSVEMCLGAELWQKSRMDELSKLVELGFRVIAYDEFPTSPKWGSEACRATNHLHRPNDLADEWRVTLELIRRLSAYAHEHGVLLSSEEPSAMLLPFTSGYMDGAFNEPPAMYEHWQAVQAVQRIPLFSTMFGAQLTPYTRIGGEPKPPKPWMVQEKVPGPPTSG